MFLFDVIFVSCTVPLMLTMFCLAVFNFLFVCIYSSLCVLSLLFPFLFVSLFVVVRALQGPCGEQRTKNGDKSPTRDRRQKWPRTFYQPLGCSLSSQILLCKLSSGHMHTYTCIFLQANKQISNQMHKQTYDQNTRS